LGKVSGLFCACKETTAQVEAAERAEAERARLR